MSGSFAGAPGERTPVHRSFNFGTQATAAAHWSKDLV